MGFKGEGAPEQAKFNMGLMTLERIHNSFKICAECSRRGDELGWNNELLVLTREVVMFLDESNKLEKIQVEKIMELRSNVAKIMGTYHQTPHHRNDNYISGELYAAMDKYEMYLRRVAMSKGLIMDAKDDEMRFF